MYRRIVFAAAQGVSFSDAAEALAELGELKILPKRVWRAAKRIGEERMIERREAAARYEQLPLPAQRQSPTGQAPQLACVQMDGGRLQQRERIPSSTAAEDADALRKDGFWKEYKAGLLMSMHSDVHAADPCPMLPATLWRKFFSRYTPILDFVHALMYVYAGAMTGRSAHEGWSCYRDWAQWLWSGEAAKIIAALRLRQHELGVPEAKETGTPRAQVAASLAYLSNQQERMQYDEYRKQGLPLTSSPMESTVKQINRRLKGAEKFWSDGADPMLHLVADRLSQTQALDKFWSRRTNSLIAAACYQQAA